MVSNSVLFVGVSTAFSIIFVAAIEGFIGVSVDLPSGSTVVVIETTASLVFAAWNLAVGEGFLIVDPLCE
jgi:hypothetical protein